MADLAKSNRLAYNKHAHSTKVNYRINVGNVNDSCVTGVYVHDQTCDNVRSKRMVYANRRSRGAERSDQEAPSNLRKISKNNNRRISSDRNGSSRD
jgi:hypothetical protein